jgi:lipopolysaccharide biosynthesis glycosyltransferase
MDMLQKNETAKKDDKDFVIAFVTDSKYLPYALFQCSEIWKFNRNQKIFILFNSTGELANEWKAFISIHPQLEIGFLKTSEIPNNLHSERHVSESTYLKLLLPTFLSGRYKVALYLDPDILILRNPFKFLSKISNPTHLSAVRIHDSEGSHLQGFQSPYFNAGVMIFNLQSVIVKDLSNNLRNLSDRKYKYQDQDLLNLVFKSKWTEISNKMNYFPYKSLNLKKRIPYVIHFVGPDKPWVSHQPTWHHIYWILRWNKFQEKFNRNQNRIHLSFKQRLFPFFWMPGARLLLKAYSALIRPRFPER